MRRLTSAVVLSALVVVLAACSGSGGPESTSTSAPEANITMANFAFSGAETVGVGQTITITNEDTVGHTWTEVDGEFDSGTLAEGESFEFSFDEPGEYDYFCAIHPTMTGTVTVEG